MSVAEACEYAGDIYVAGGPEGDAAFWRYSPGANSWTQIGLSVPQPDHVSELLGVGDTLYWVNGRGEAIYAYVPEPATVALLALGGLAVVRRRLVSKLGQLCVSGLQIPLQTSDFFIPGLQLGLQPG